MQRAIIKVYGFVQGVGFRANAKRLALRLGLKGYAKNNDDCSVEIVVEGHEDKIKELIEFCKNGPKLAKVSKVDIKFEMAKNEFDGFGIRF